MQAIQIHAYNADPQQCVTANQSAALVALDLELLTFDRAEAAAHALHCINYGYWVEVYVGDELIAGPLDPDQPAPAYIL